MFAISSSGPVVKAKQQRQLRLLPMTLALAAVTLLPTSRAFAVSKEMVQLQTQIQQLQDAVARLQQSNDERMGVMKDLVQQTADSINKMSVTVQSLQHQIGTGSEAQGTKLDQVSGQVQSLNDSLDELKARLQRIEKGVADVQNTQQSLGARMESAPASSASPATTGAPEAFPTDSTIATPTHTPKTTRTTQAPPPGFPADTPDGRVPSTDAAPASTPRAGNAPPVTDLYQTAFGDYNGAKYKLATAEFQDVIRYYPDNSLAGNAYFYLGEILFKTKDYGPATRQYDKVIEGFPGNPKIPAAQLRKGQALIGIKQTDAGVRELKSLVARYPNSPEAVTARAKLTDLGISARR